MQGTDTGNGMFTQVNGAAGEVHAAEPPPLAHAVAVAEALGRRVSRFVRDNPGTALLGALALGVAVGKLASRR